LGDHGFDASTYTSIQSILDWIKTNAEAYSDATGEAVSGGVTETPRSLGERLQDAIDRFRGGLGSWGFDVGTPYVPQDMTARVHAGETIIPKTFADGIRSGEMVLSGGGNSRSASLSGGDVYITVEGSVLTERELVEVVREGFARTNMRVSA
jgi:hypothetical protein